MQKLLPKIIFFPYFGPNRRSDCRVLEIMLDFDPNQAEVAPQQIDDVRQTLRAAGLETRDDDYAGIDATQSPHLRFSQLLAQTALLLQQKNGHRVSFYSVNNEPDKNRVIVLVEHEDSKVGMAAVKLAIDVVSGRIDSFKTDYRLFCRYAHDRLLPLETHTIIKLARQRRIPVVQAEREPLTGLFNTGFRVRPNSLLILGHASHSHVLDGTFCVDKADDRLKALLQNPGQRLSLLRKLGFVIAETQPHATAESSERAANRHFHVLLVNRKVWALEQSCDGAMSTVDKVHESLIELCRTLYVDTGCAAIGISLSAASLANPLLHSNVKALDFNPAPDLQQLLADDQDGASLMDAAAGELLDWLFPDPQASRIPVIAVTGTNGKTTTSRMINHILQTSGRKPGLVCTDGIFLNGQLVNQADASTFLGHARVLTSPQVDTAVLETHHRGIAVRGFAFDDCDIAVCLNVTEEHLEKGEIETLEEMTAIKRALMERARQMAILFADDPRCLSMVEHLNAARICLVSLQSKYEQLKGQLGGQLTSQQACFCVLETLDNESWIVLYDEQLRIPVMPVNQIPATFDGHARFNISNAMHALAACYFSGTTVNAISSALGGFSAGEKFTPGRMNEIEGLPFRLIIDFAHNPDGMKQVCDFVDNTHVSGRKVLGFAVAINRTDEAGAKVARAAAGHFDFYFCKDYQPKEGEISRYMGPLIQQVLIDEGVPEEQTTVITYGKQAIYSILDACEPGDLLILLLGNVEKQIVPGYIREYASLRFGTS